MSRSAPDRSGEAPPWKGSLVDAHAHLDGIEDQALLEDGYTVSATPALEYSKGHIEAIRRALLDRILIETDCPVAYRGKPSRPADLLTTLRALARIKALDEAEGARATTHNALAFYGLIS